MNRKNRMIEVYGLWFADLMVVLVSFVLATYIRFGNFKDMNDKEIHFQVCLVALLFCTVYSFFLEWNHQFLKRGYAKEFYAVFKYNVFMLLVTQTIMAFLKWADTFSRLVMAYFVVINLLLSFIVHITIKKIIKMHYKSDLSKIKVLVITQSDLASAVKEKLTRNLDINYEIVQTVLIEEWQEDFLEKATFMAVDEVFIYTPVLSQKKVQEIISAFDEMGVDCHYCVKLDGIWSDRSSIGEFGNYSVITYTRFRSSYKKYFVKRVMDIAGGLVGMLITILFYPFVALAIKMDSPGPVLFSQVRIGRNGRRFKIYKFRSMYMDAEERKKELEKQNEMQGLMFKMENDPRITKVGRFIRKSSIDELPQFYNVLRGDMSLVGTRPPTADEFEKYDQYYRRRISMTPGLTGLWQVSGRSEIENFDDVVKYDLEYIDNWSLTLDVKILLRTVWVVIAGRGSK
ncbi:MAG: sugar transferase [Lachnospiraceae bacterium]|nr:sugar transferase [Lachnospiraceae bacterium]